MAKHLDGNIQQYINEKLKEQYHLGLAAGSYAMCKNIHDKIEEDGPTAEEKLQWIKEFCGPLINLRKPNKADEVVSGDEV